MVRAARVHAEVIGGSGRVVSVMVWSDSGRARFSLLTASGIRAPFEASSWRPSGRVGPRSCHGADPGLRHSLRPEPAESVLSGFLPRPSRLLGLRTGGHHRTSRCSSSTIDLAGPLGCTRMTCSPPVACAAVAPDLRDAGKRRCCRASSLGLGGHGLAGAAGANRDGLWLRPPRRTRMGIASGCFRRDQSPSKGAHQCGKRANCADKRRMFRKALKSSFASCSNGKMSPHPEVAQVGASPPSIQVRPARWASGMGAGGRPHGHSPASRPQAPPAAGSAARRCAGSRRPRWRGPSVAVQLSQRISSGSYSPSGKNSGRPARRRELADDGVALPQRCCRRRAAGWARADWG